MAEIRIVDLTFKYKDKTILDRVSFVVPEGSVYALTGPSGEGKTTLLRLLAGFLQPDEGEIYLGGKLVSSPSFFAPPKKRGIGMVFQSLALWPHLSAKEHLILAGEKKEAEHLIEISGMKEFENLRPDSLSGGQKQRLAIARSLCGDPQVLLLDEPFSQLDPPYRLEMNRLFAGILNHSKKTVLLVTHNIKEVELPISGCILLEDGAIRGPAPIRELLKLSQSNYARLLLEWLR